MRRRCRKDKERGVWCVLVDENRKVRPNNKKQEKEDFRGEVYTRLDPDFHQKGCARLSDSLDAYNLLVDNHL